MENQNQASGVNGLLTYVNQLDPLVPNNDQNYEVWYYALRTTDLHTAKRVVVDYYASIDPHNREPITPGYIRRQARRLETRLHRDTVMCLEHDWNHRDTCAECISEIAAGDRRPDQQGQQIREIIAAPEAVRRQLRQVLAAKDIDQDT